MKENAIWSNITDKYEILQVLGVGAFGQVVRAKHILTGNLVAIKLITNVFESNYAAKKLVSEVHILRKLSAVPGNTFTTKIYDIIVPKNFKNSSND